MRGWIAAWLGVAVIALSGCASAPQVADSMAPMLAVRLATVAQPDRAITAMPSHAAIQPRIQPVDDDRFIARLRCSCLQHRPRAGAAVLDPDW